MSQPVKSIILTAHLCFPQAVILEYRMDRTVATGDEPPLVLACMPGSFVERMGLGLRPGKLLRFFVEEPGIQVRRPVARLHFTPQGPQPLSTACCLC